MYDEIFELLKKNTEGYFTSKDAKDILDFNNYKYIQKTDEGFRIKEISLGIEEVIEVLNELSQNGYLDFDDSGKVYKYKVI
ncbi:hypothetical protein SNUCP2_03720 [Clostridium perfringens A]|uniref:hypothetical protein n=1 Tax=Clostridium perfringens TaxID=1502 RepID=UPI00399C9A87